VHIGIIAWIFHLLLNLFSVPLPYRSGVLAIVLFFFAGLTGFHFPVLRAVIMGLVFYFSITCNRIPDSLYSLAFAVALILLLFPSALFEVSLQLTVAATACILLFFRCLRQQAWFERIRQFPVIFRLPVLSLMATTGAMIGVSPLIMYYFGTLSLYSFVSNVVAFPLVSLLLPSSLFVNFLALVVRPWELLFPLLTGNIFLAKGLILLAAVFPETNLAIPRPPLLLLIFYYLGIYGLGRLCSKKARHQVEFT
jgi:competence protein ComEC